MIRIPPQSERQFQGEVVKVAKLHRWWAYHTLDSRGSQAGWPDLVLIKPPRLLFWELKIGSAQLRDEQFECMQLLASCSQIQVQVMRPSLWPLIARELGAA